jgi:hypothetical protein
VLCHCLLATSLLNAAACNLALRNNSVASLCCLPAPAGGLPSAAVLQLLPACLFTIVIVAVIVIIAVNIIIIAIIHCQSLRCIYTSLSM